MGNCKCFMTKMTLKQCLMSSESKIKGCISVDREVHYNNKGIQHPSKIGQREHCFNFFFFCYYSVSHSTIEII